MKNYVIIIPFHNPWDWHTDYTNQTANLLAKHHTVLCFLWGDAISIREIIVQKKRYRPITRKGNLWFYHPLFLVPGKRILSMQYINMSINLIFLQGVASYIALIQKKLVLFWFFGIFDPVFTLLPRFFLYTKTLYDCVDVPAHPDEHLQKHLQKTEKLLLRHAWIVTANSHVSQKRLMSLRSDIHLVPLGFRVEMFQKYIRHPINTGEKHPVIGYIGAVDYRINIPLLERLISHRAWRFVIAGPIFADHLAPSQQNRLRSLLKQPNVTYSCVPYSSIPGILSACDVTIIPYRNTVFNAYAFPMKTMEYLYAQKRIIASSQIKELHWYTPLVLHASSISNWEKQLTFAIRNPLNTHQKRLAKKIALQHTWEKKIQSLCRIIEDTQ